MHRGRQPVRRFAYYLANCGSPRLYDNSFHCSFIRRILAQLVWNERADRRCSRLTTRPTHRPKLAPPREGRSCHAAGIGAKRAACRYADRRDQTPSSAPMNVHSSERSSPLTGRPREDRPATVRYFRVHRDAAPCLEMAKLRLSLAEGKPGGDLKKVFSCGGDRRFESRLLQRRAMVEIKRSVARSSQLQCQPEQDS
jgi:hypothetical protein